MVRAEIPGIVVNASGRSYPLEQAIIAARNQWRAEGRPLPRSSYTTDDLPMRERLDRLERAMALLGEECPPRHAGRVARSSPLYDQILVSDSDAATTISKLATVGISATVMER